jgi:hypothetical protein
VTNRLSYGTALGRNKRSFKANMRTSCAMYNFELHRLNFNKKLVVSLKSHQRDVKEPIGARNRIYFWKHPEQEEAVYGRRGRMY